MLAQELLNGAAAPDRISSVTLRASGASGSKSQRVAGHADSQSPCRNASKLDRTNSSLPVGIGASIALSRGDPRPGTKKAPRQQGFPEARTAGFEPATFGSGDRRSSPELRALGCPLRQRTRAAA